MSALAFCPISPSSSSFSTPFHSSLRKPIASSLSAWWRSSSYRLSRCTFNTSLKHASNFGDARESKRSQFWHNAQYSHRVAVYNSYAAPNDSKDSASVPIDVVADVKTERIVVLGGTGFVGSVICKAAISNGIEVVSLSRSGKPSYTDAWVDQVTWVAGDVFNADWDEVLTGATAVVSTIGGFGNEEEMKRINGDANILAVGAAKDHGVPKFVLISVHDCNLPSFLLSSGYFTGKRKAESEVLSKYPTSGVVLRPTFIYGKRKVDGLEIPLDLIGKPLERLLLATERFINPLISLPFADLFAPPVSVEDVAYAAVNAVINDDFFGIFAVDQIREAAAKVRT